MIRFKKLFYEYVEDAWEHFSDQVDSHLEDILGGFVSGQEKIKWRRVKAARLIKIWQDFGKTGVLRDEKGILEIKKNILNNISRLHVTNALAGHSQNDPTEMIERAGFDEQIDLEDDDTAHKFFWEYMEDDDGSAYISDYGLPKLEALYPALYNEQDPERLLYIIDKVLNVVHQRSDLATVFIEGGTKTLLKIADYQPEDYGEED
jgi:hypothetical protein